MQRNGTSSCGQFLKDFGYRVATYPVSSQMGWSYDWLDGNFDAIFKSLTFHSFQAYEDDPWWSPDFYKYIYYRFPKSRFILFSRDSNKWFDSMLRHSKGKNPGNTYGHSKVYQRLYDYYFNKDQCEGFNPANNQVDNLLTLEGKREHYIRVYETYNREVLDFFENHNPSRLFTGKLEDDNKWIKLGEFLNISVSPEYNVHIK